MELSERLHAVASMVTAGNTVADVGCDHGYVAIWLVQNKICPKVIAMDVNKGPLARAKENIQIYGLTDYIETRLSNGTKALQDQEVDALICAGMGGKLMAQILQDGMDKVSHMTELILQPQSELAEMRAFLRMNGMQIIAEDMVRDENKFYPMMKVLVHGQDVDRTDSPDWEQQMEDNYGPCLLQAGHPILKEFLEKRMEICDTILSQLQQQDPTERQQIRMTEMNEEMRNMNKVLQQYF